MNNLNVFPILSTLLGLLLILFILFSRSGLGKDKRIRIVLSALLMIYVITSIDYYLTIGNQIDEMYSGVTYIFYHLIGVLFYYFISLFTKHEIRLRKWIPVIVVYTLIRILVFLPFDHLQNLSEFVESLDTSSYGVFVLFEYLFVSFINIILMLLALVRLKSTPLVIELNESQKTHYKWIKTIAISIIVMQIVVFFTTLLGSSDIPNFNSYLQFETLIYCFFFFLFAFSIMHFPIFAYSGNYADLSDTISQKYANSSLNNSQELFIQIKKLVKDEKLYLEFDLKLNTIADSLDQSIHHISQAINQNAEKSFPDFINEFRIEDAKIKLLISQPDTIFAISLDVGFNSKAAFYTAFRKYTKMTPTEFKNIHNPKSIPK